VDSGCVGAGGTYIFIIYQEDGEGGVEERASIVQYQECMYMAGHLLLFNGWLVHPELKSWKSGCM
jgi:hypothetical protein